MPEELTAVSMHQSQPSVIERFIDERYHEKIWSDYAGFVADIRKSMDDTGLAIVENFIHPDFLTELRCAVDRLTPICYEGEKRKTLIGGDLQNTGFYEITFSDWIIQLVNDILEPFNAQIEPGDVHPVVNILVGKKAQEDVTRWHFDATYLTIALPVVMPAPASQGDGKFRIWPNVRQFSQSRWRNKLFWNLAKIAFLRRIVKNQAINFVPGNLYFFYGFRSYHGTQDLDPNQLRANCLINFGGPFFDLEKGKVIKYRK